MKMYHELRESFQKQNRILFIALCVTLITLFLTTLQSYRNNIKIVKESESVFSEEASLSQICQIAFESLKSGISSDIFLSKELAKGIDKAEFVLDVDKIYPAIVFQEEMLCKVVTTDKKGLRAFEAKLDRNSKYKLGVILKDITEIQIDQNSRPYKGASL